MISATNVGYIIHIDLSNLGWGAHDEDPNIKGRWCDSEKTLHINYLELLAIKLAIKSFLSRKDLVRHLIIMCDNSTKVANINKEVHNLLHVTNLLKIFWIICMENGLHVSAAHVPGKHNILAEIASRKLHDASEWILSKSSSII